MARNSLDLLTPTRAPGNTGIVPPSMRPGAQAASSLPVRYNPPSLSTGGPLPPTQYNGGDVSMPPTGGPNPPVPYQPMPPTGGPQPPVPYNGNTGVVPPNLQTGGGLPPTQYGGNKPMPPTGGPQPPVKASSDWINQLLGQINGNDYVANAKGPNGENLVPGAGVQTMVDQFMNGQYGQNAYRRGVEQAGRRGLVNSSIAGGQAQRAALEAVQPFVQQAVQQQENAVDRVQQVNNALLASRLNMNEFNNQFNANLSLLPVSNSMQMLQALTQYALQDPEVYTPEVMSGFTTFFNNNMLTMLKQYFPDRVTTGGS